MGSNLHFLSDRVARFRGWTNQELAELYRVEHALTQANIGMETDQGITDEGDPWFVFCRLDGSVLVHITRSDGAYQLYSPVLAKSLSGPSFAALTKAFVGTVPVSSRSVTEGGVTIHPGAFLGLLIAAIFFSCDIRSTGSPRTEVGNSADESHAMQGHANPAAKAGLVQAVIDHFTSAVDWLSGFPAEQAAADWLLVGRVVISAAMAVLIGSDNVETATPAAPAAVPGSASTMTDSVADHPAATYHRLDVTLLDDGSNVSAGRMQGPVALSHDTRIETDANYVATPAFDMMSEPALGKSSEAASDAQAEAWGIKAIPEIGLQSAAKSSTAVTGETLVAAFNAAQSDQLDIVLSGPSRSIDIDGSLTLRELVLSGDGELKVSGITSIDPLSIYVTSGSHQDLFLSYQAVAPESSVTQTVTLGGADTESLVEAPNARSTTIALTVDSEGSHANALNLSDAASSGNGTFDIRIVGAQDLTLNESVVSFTSSKFDASELTGNLTVGIDFGANANISVNYLTLGPSNFIVHENDSVALVNLADNSEIALGTSLDNVILTSASNSGLGSVSLELNSSSPDAIDIHIINAAGLASLSIDSNGVGPGNVNKVQGLIDTDLSTLTVSGDAALTLASIYGIGAADGQNVTVDAHALSAPFTLNVSGIDDVSAGGRQITIIGGSGGSVLTNMVAGEQTVFTGGAGINTFNIGAGAVQDSITDLKATDTVNVGSVGFTDSFVNGLTMNSADRAAVDSQNSLVDAALSASKLLGDGSAHQAVLFSYQGNEYVFVNGAGSNGFDDSRDAIVKVVGLTASIDLAGAFHSG
jgi:hypothetical protein